MARQYGVATQETDMATKLKAKPPEDVKPGHIKGNLFGASGSGKTYFALSFPKPYYIDTEGGADLAHYMERLKRSGGSYLGPQDGACDFDTILSQIQALATEKHGYKTLVIDSVTKVFQACIAKEAERLGDKDAFGASKKPAIAYMRRLVAWVARLDMNVWFISHETTKWGTIGGNRQEIGKTADAWDKLVYELDLTLQVQKHNKGFRTATVTKSRLLGFPDGDRFPLQQEGNDVGYTEFATRYGKDFIEGDAVPIVLASAEQVSAIKAYLEVLKLSEEEVSKILTRANADAWEELTEDQASKAIEWFKKKAEVTK